MGLGYSTRGAGVVLLTSTLIVKWWNLLPGIQHLGHNGKDVRAHQCFAHVFKGTEIENGYIP